MLNTKRETIPNEKILTVMSKKRRGRSLIIALNIFVEAILADNKGSWQKWKDDTFLIKDMP